MKQSLQLRLSQHLALTPQLQQSIRLLQLSTLELQNEIAAAISQNPLLELDDNWSSKSSRVAADGSVCNDSSTHYKNEPNGSENNSNENKSEDLPDASAKGDSIRLETAAQDATSDTSNWSLDEYSRPSSSRDDDDMPPLQLQEVRTSLRDELLEQLNLTRVESRDHALATLLIESLNHNGYLTESLDEIVDDFPEELNINIDELTKALALVQSFSPAGVAARTASECLRLQLIRLDACPSRQIALTIVDKYLDLLAVRDFTRLKKYLKIDDAALRKAQALIQTLEPYPGAAFNEVNTDYVVPDVIVKKVSGTWLAELNLEVIPKLRINSLYANILRSHRNDAGGSLRQQLQEARWLIKNIQQRFETILKVAQAIVDRQKGYFAHGEIAMRPLVLREIADILGLHESTVSRVTTGKYMLTPYGTLEFKYFFGSHISTDTGGAASSTAIRALIKQLISAENPKTPLSDSRIAELLAAQGFVVARRTVAKYREALRIRAVNLRKVL